MALKRALLLCKGGCVEPEHLKAGRLELATPAAGLPRRLEMKRSTLWDRLAKMGIHPRAGN